MPDPLMYQEDNFVVLETNHSEQFLTASELLTKLIQILHPLQKEDLPLDLQKFPTPQAQAEYLLNTSCELNLYPGEYLQWYAVRLEK